MSESKKISRRDFLKVGSILGATAAVGGTRLFIPHEADAQTISFSFMQRTYSTIDEMYPISANYKRFDEKNTAFNRAAWDPPSGMPVGQFISFFSKDDGLVHSPERVLPGYMPYDHALHIAGWWGEEAGAKMSRAGAHSSGVLNDWKVYAYPTKERYQFESKDEAARIVKRASLFLGADLVGIAPYDERWLYSKWYDVRPFVDARKDPIYEDAILPFQPKTVIATAYEMDYDGIKAAGEIADAAVGLEYTHMSEVSARIAAFLNQLGYRAIPAGNDTGLSIPIAVQAGLGELGRMGTLITQKFGGRVRLAKVYTDLDMTIDRPTSFGVKEFCLRCKKCADLCPAGAISKKDQPTQEADTGTKSSNTGVMKWYHNAEHCLGQWDRNGTSCSVCLRECPFNKLNTWNHQMAKTLATLPVGRDVARQLDDLFGYGKANPAENAAYFWNKKD